MGCCKSKQTQKGFIDQFDFSSSSLMRLFKLTQEEAQNFKNRQEVRQIFQSLDDIIQRASIHSSEKGFIVKDIIELVEVLLKLHRQQNAIQTKTKEVNQITNVNMLKNEQLSQKYKEMQQTIIEEQKKEQRILVSRDRIKQEELKLSKVWPHAYAK